jgi:hypothetical protein
MQTLLLTAAMLVPSSQPLAGLPPSLQPGYQAWLESESIGPIGRRWQSTAGIRLYCTGNSEPCVAAAGESLWLRPVPRLVNSSEPGTEAREPPRPSQSPVEAPKLRDLPPPVNPPVAIPPVTPEKPGTTEEVRINVPKLIEEITGWNEELHTVEAELRTGRPWTAERLAELVEQMHVAMIRREDLSLFRDLAWEIQGEQVLELEAPWAAVSELGTRIFQARLRTTGSGFDGTETQRREELKRLDHLSRRLADIGKVR